jgi:pimeloyl-ACP methyl ester carboxylesterase
VEAVLRQFDFTYMTPDVARRLTMPVLLIWGELDTTVPIATGRRLRDLLPNARMVSLSGTWHRPQLERPDEVAAAIESFTTGDARQPLADTPPPR